MAKFAQKIQAELDPRQPVSEACAVIDVMIAHNQQHEEAILRGISEAIENRMAQLKGDESDA